MTETPRKRGRPPRKGPRVEGAGISLYPNEIELLDRLAQTFALNSRADVLRRLIRDHPIAQKEAA